MWTWSSSESTEHSHIIQHQDVEYLQVKVLLEPCGGVSTACIAAGSSLAVKSRRALCILEPVGQHGRVQESLIDSQAEFSIPLRRSKSQSGTKRIMSRARAMPTGTIDMAIVTDSLGSHGRDSTRLGIIVLVASTVVKMNCAHKHNLSLGQCSSSEKKN